MYAIVSIAGQQMKVSEGQELFVHRLAAEVGTELSFEDVLLIGTDDSTSVGQPTIASASVQAEVMDHLKGDKVIVFKKKRRKGYRVKNGHRQYLSKIKIKSINP